MKQFKLFAVIGLLSLASCTDEGRAEIENNLVVELIKKNELNKECSSCFQNNYEYRVRLKSESGAVWYYTNYKHEVGDTLVSIFEFTDSRERVLKNRELAIDSLADINKKLQKKNDELILYNELLIGIIQDGAKKTAGN